MPVPRATYRLQFQPEFPFRQGVQSIEYLDKLGISTLYSSPILKAKKGSLHGYDPTDFSEVNQELGGLEDFLFLAHALKEKNMGILLDIVPNHMCIIEETNRWWRDVLAKGSASSYASYFYIEWAPLEEALKGKVLLPILEEQFGIMLEKGEISLILRDGELEVKIPGQVLPINSKTKEALFKKISKKTQFTQESPYFLAAIEKEISKINSKTPSSFTALEKILQQQFYRLCFWKVANDEINYRRFFDVNELAYIRSELPEVFQDAHAVILPLLKNHNVAGVRIDHIDGIYDPEQYLIDFHSASGRDDLYVLVEKILMPGEKLQSQWRVQGSTGYDFLNQLNQLFVDQRNKEEFHRIYHDFTGNKALDSTLLFEARESILQTSLAAELQFLSLKLDRIAEQHRMTRDFTRAGLRLALKDVIASFPVYRTYLRAKQSLIHAEDRQLIQCVIRKAKRKNPATNASIFDFIQQVLLFQHPDPLSSEQIQVRKEFVMSFQQMTGSAMAKGLEDTAFYRYYPLVSLNEVGADPFAFGSTVEAFHAANHVRRQEWPASMLCTSTHDTKRSEDVRARINVLSEMPTEWKKAIQRWRGINSAYKSTEDGEMFPDSNLEYLLYQTLVGTWPLQPIDANYVNRITAYMQKASKEAKLYTSWTNPYTAYDQAIAVFVQGILQENGRFLSDFEAFMQPVIKAGMYNSLSQVLIKATAPGVPDFYQGNELWRYQLVDPDNRSPVDLAPAQMMLHELIDNKVTLSNCLEDLSDGKIKLFFTYCCLNVRRQFEEVFSQGSYDGLTVEGGRQDQVIAYCRSFGNQQVITLSARFFMRLHEAKDWEGTEVLLPDGDYHNALTGNDYNVLKKRIALSQIFKVLPFALLVKRG